MDAAMPLEAAQGALNRMKRAYDRGTGCHLDADMIAALGATFLGQVWEEPDPRKLQEDN